jgi:hypothetical protein
VTSRRSTSARGTAKGSGRRNGAIIAGSVAAVALIAFILASVSDGGGSSGETAEVSISGTVLPDLLQQQGLDPAVGMAMPELRGVAFDGTAVTITNDGRPKILLFLAHW